MPGSDVEVERCTIKLVLLLENMSLLPLQARGLETPWLANKPPRDYFSKIKLSTDTWKREGFLSSLLRLGKRMRSYSTTVPYSTVQ